MKEIDCKNKNGRCMGAKEKHTSEELCFIPLLLDVYKLFDTNPLEWQIICGQWDLEYWATISSRKGKYNINVINLANHLHSLAR